MQDITHTDIPATNVMRSCIVAPSSRPAAAKLIAASGLAAMLATMTTIPSTAFGQAVELVRVDVTTVAKGYRTSRLTGQEVFNERNEEIGEIDDFIIGRDRVLFTILQVGGFLGLGSHLVAVPYQSLDLESQQNRVVLKGASKESLRKLPQFEYGSH